VWHSIIKLNGESNTVDIEGLGVFEVTAYLDNDLNEVTQVDATNVKVSTGVSIYYFPIM
jgi:hypothetical protein